MVGTLALVSILKATDAVRAEAQEKFFEQYNLQQLLLAEQAAHSVEQTFHSFHRILSLVSGLFENQTSTPERALLLDNSLVRIYQGLSDSSVIDLVVFDNAGTVISIVPYDSYTLGRNYAWRNYFRWAKNIGRRGQMYLSPFMQLEGGQNRGDKALIVAQGIYDSDERFQGVAMLTVNFDKLAEKQILSVRIGEQGFAWLVDVSEQTVLVDPLGKVTDRKFKETFFQRWPKLYALLRSFSNGEPGMSDYEYIDPVKTELPVRKLVGYHPIKIENNLWMLGVATPAREVDALFSSFLHQQERYTNTMVFVVLFVTLLLCALLLAWNHHLSRQVSGHSKDLEETRSRLESTFDELLAAKKLAAVGHLALGLAHEIRNPLTAIRMNIQMIRKRYQPQTELQENFAIVEDEMLRLNRLVNDVMDFARTRPLRLESTSVAAIIRRVLQLFEQRFEEAGIRVDVELETSLTAVCDPEQIEQVILNLTSNAIEAMENCSGPRLLTLIGETLENCISIQVIDSGCGIRPELRDQIFDPFFTTKSAGGGLGLSTLQGIVLHHQGSISVDTTSGENTRFTLQLPLEAQRHYIDGFGEMS
ncbi:MAG: GHKL domain-containing protein [Gammaproteobacteria bacterium]|nr:GHKL domain-containing protein [Gammaproteobacteria bacterium]